MFGPSFPCFLSHFLAVFSLQESSGGWFRNDSFRPIATNIVDARCGRCWERFEEESLQM
jgi:hypothetical protein